MLGVIKEMPGFTMRPLLLRGLSLKVLLTLFLYTSLPAYGAQPADDLHCDEPADMMPRGAVLVTHGLNNDPASLLPLCKELLADGLAACRLTLAGHHPADSMLDVTRRLWLKQYRSAYDELSRRYNQVPLYALGYSLGAAMTIHFLDQHPEQRFKSMVLLAPPVSLRSYVGLMRVLTPLRVLNLSLPSAAPKGYRVHSFTSLDAYHATLETVSKISTPNNPPALQKTPALIVLSKKDELIDYKGVTQWLARNTGNWELKEIKRDKDARTRLDHLIIDPASLGRRPWSALTSAVKEFLN